VVVSDILEKWWFKWAAIGAALMMTLIVVGSGFFLFYSEEAERRRVEWETFSERLEHEEQVRMWMTRIYQNLKLEHFLAAYQNVRNMPKPGPEDFLLKDEFMSLLKRIGQGLLVNGMLKESEEIFELIRDYDHESSLASEALTEIDSRRKLNQARSYLADGKRMLEQGQYRSALAELQKAEIELNSVAFNQFKGIEAELAQLKEMMREARFYTRLEDAQREVDEAKKALQIKDFNRTHESMVKAARFVGQAAFLNPTADQVRSIRNQLLNIEADLGFELPNATPLWNKMPKDLAGREAYFFHLDSYDFDIKPGQENIVRIGLNYLRRRDQRVFIIRYRITMDDNRSFFNGHFLKPDPDQTSDTDMLAVIYEQEIPPRFRNSTVKRIEVRVFDEDNRPLARITRAFRTDS
jgi:tetratricopeptide (TPR) repeat protein